MLTGQCHVDCTMKILSENISKTDVRLVTFKGLTMLLVVEIFLFLFLFPIFKTFLLVPIYEAFSLQSLKKRFF